MIIGISMIFTQQKKTIVVQKENKIILVQGKRTNITKLENINNINQVNNKYLLYDKSQKLYIYNIKKKKSIIITDKIYQLQNYNDKYVTYIINNQTYIYNIKKKKSKKIGNVNLIAFSNNKKNIIYYKDNYFAIYNLNKNKEIIKINDLTQYNCINNSCTDFYYVTQNKLKRYHKKETDLNQKVINILYQNKETIIYQNQENNNYILYYKKGKKKAVKLDTSKRPFEDVKTNKNKIIYLTGGNCIEIKKNGKKRKIVARDIKRIVDIYRGKYLLIKNQSLYLNDKLLDKKVVEDKISIINNKIYYLKNNGEIYTLIERTPKKSKIINNNVIEMKTMDDTIYYLGDYNLNYKYGNIYLLNNKKYIIQKANHIISNSI